MWLDDYLIILPMTVIIVYCIIPWILPSVAPGEHNLMIIFFPLTSTFLIIKIPGQSIQMTMTLGRVTCSLLQSFGKSTNCLAIFTTQFAFHLSRFSRICFMLSIARILPLGKPSRSRILLIAWFFAVLYCACMILAVCHCDPMDGPNRHCVVFALGHPINTYIGIGSYFDFDLI